MIDLLFRGTDGTPVVTGVTAQWRRSLEADSFVIAAPLHSARQIMPAVLREIAIL